MMLTLYLVCLAFGGILVLVSVIGGFDGGDVDVDVDAGGHDFGGHDVDVQGGDIDHQMDHVDGQALHSVFQYLSFRALVFFIAFFGLTGTLLTLLGGSTLVNLVASLVMGVGSGVGIQGAIGYLQRNESGQGFDLKQLEGNRARVLLDCTRDRRGKISVNTQDRTMQLLALVADEAVRDGFKSGDDVMIVTVRDGVAYVSGEDFVK